MAYKTGTVFVVKGEIPAMLLTQMGYLACAPTGGEGAKLDRWKPIFAHFERIIVIGDNDKTGIWCAKERAELLDGRVVFPPQKFKDIDEFTLLSLMYWNILLVKEKKSNEDM